MSASHPDASRVIDYFCVVGLPAALTAQPQQQHQHNDTAGLNAPSLASSSTSNLTQHEHDQHLLRNIELESSKPTTDKLEPIVEIAVLNKSLGEIVPHGYECLWQTPSGHSANLCPGDLFRQTEFFLLVRRGLDKPPIADIGVFYDTPGERVMEGCTVLRTTIDGHMANLNQATSSFSADRVYVTYRRATELACNALAVIDVCVVAKNRGETAPHSYNEIKRELSKGLFGGPSVYICYKKAWIAAPQLKYSPTVLHRYPAVDHVDLPFPNEVASFGLPMGASIESWPKTRLTNNQKPSFSTFVLNVNSDDGLIMEKVYGTALTFYESFPEAQLIRVQRLLLESLVGTGRSDTRDLYSIKCLIILSRFPLFDTFRKFLLFVYDKYSSKDGVITSNGLVLPIERFLAYMIYEVPFPTQQKPSVLVNLTEHEEDCLSIGLPHECILPQSGAQFTELLANLGVENSISVFLFVMLQRSVMVHSLRKQVLTSVVEAISCIIFPFIWRYAYIPMCPLVLCQMIEAPGSFILGMDTRFFDMFDPPPNVLCVDLDTNTLSWTPERQTINLKILPKRPLATLRTKLGHVELDIKQLNEAKLRLASMSIATTTTAGSRNARTELEAKIKRTERNIDLTIREAYLRFMASILNNYKSFLRTVTRRPDTRAIDRNLATFFDSEGFLRSKESSCQFFYTELIKTQLFYDCVMNLSFTSELDPVLADSFAFFAEICSRMNIATGNREDITELRLLEYIEHSNNQTVVTLPPGLDDKFLVKFTQGLVTLEITNELIEQYSSFVYNTTERGCFPKTKFELWLTTASRSNANSTPDLNSSYTSGGVHDTANSERKSSLGDTQSIHSFRRPNKLETPVTVRTKAEKLHDQKRIVSKLNVKLSNNLKANEKAKFAVAKHHAFHFLSNAYALWFMCLPGYVRECGSESGAKKSALNYAYQVLIQMQTHSLTQPDEICYRIMMKLCELYQFPTLAVKTFLHMRKYKIDITPITYSYYNKALIDASSWPAFEQDRWAKVRLIWLVVGKFRQNLTIKRQREELARKRNRRSGGKKSSGKTLKRRGTGGGHHIRANTLKKNNLIADVKATSTNAYNSAENTQNIIAVVAPIDLPPIPREPEIVPTIHRNGESLKNDMKSILLSKERSVNPNLVIANSELFLSPTGILTVSKYMKSSKVVGGNEVLSSERKTQLKLIDHLNLSNASLSSSASLTKITFTNHMKKENSAPAPVQITSDDPLGAFATDSSKQREVTPSTITNSNTAVDTAKPSTNKILNNFDDIKRRLFDYKPFADQAKTSDFLFEKPQPKQRVPQQEVASNSYDSDIYTDSEEDESLENGSAENRSDYENEELYDDEAGLSDDDDYYEEEDDLGDDDLDGADTSDNSYAVNKTTTRATNGHSQDSHLDTYGAGVDSNSGRNRDVENVSISSGNGPRCTRNLTGDTAKSTPFSSPFSKLLSSTKMLSLVESSTSKLKGVTQYITEKSTEIKEVIMANSSQQELSYKLKTLSNYQLTTPAYLNGFIKSKTTLTTLSGNVPGGSATSSVSSQKRHTDGHGSHKSGNAYGLMPSTQQIDYALEHNAAFESKFDLEQIPSDDTYKPLPFGWWDVEKDGHAGSNFHTNFKEVYVDVQISSCNYCENCKSFLYDEDIMSAWTLKESDLNINCLYCFKSIVPKLYIKIHDYETLENYVKRESSETTDANESDAKTETSKLNDESHPFLNLEKPDESSATKNNKSQQNNPTRLNTTEFTVGYFSPLVVRKEVENIIINNNDAERVDFLVDHEIIFWNLVWYFKRVGVDNGQLVTSLLNSRARKLHAELASTLTETVNEFKFIPAGCHASAANRPFTQHPHVKVKCMWDNLKLQNEKVAHDMPLYLCWLVTNYELVVRRVLKQRMVTVLDEIELRQLRKSTISTRTLIKLYELIIRNIKDNDLLVVFKSLLRERVRSKMNSPSVYRETLFLIIVCLERELIDIDAFDSEYRETYKSMVQSDAKELMKMSDKPPNNIAVWCRRLFSPLLV